MPNSSREQHGVPGWLTQLLRQQLLQEPARQERASGFGRESVSGFSHKQLCAKQRKRRRHMEEGVRHGHLEDGFHRSEAGG